MTMTRYLAIPLALLPLMLAGCSKTREASAAAPTTPRTVAVTTAQATTRIVPAAFQETGTFIADETSDIAPLVAGRVIATPVNIGDFVRQDQVICELDHRDAQLKLDQARAALDQATAALRQSRSRVGLNPAGEGKFDVNMVPEVIAARANYDSAQAQARMAAADAKRFENLVATGDVSRSAYEKARTQQETADAQTSAARHQYEAALNTARQNWGAVENSQAGLENFRAQLAQAAKGLADNTIRAPFEGFITARPIAAGEYVALTNKIATLVRIGTMKLQLQTPEQQAARAKVGMTVVARVAAYPDREFSGKITAVNPSVDPTARSFIVEARFSNPKAELRPGMFSAARVLLPGGESAVIVPKTAVIRDKTTDSYQVFIIDNNTARLRVVVTGDPDGDLIRITNGLTGTETLATSHQSELYDGAPVTTPRASAAPPARSASLTPDPRPRAPEARSRCML
jgi:multidrug efflux pump subunit AcrA (membrane-fusion protein)